ncbi:MAG: MFS transporter [Rhizobiaceae bacterium]|nr:MFS transporter [Rhizobiaceae bacterium]
MAGSIPVSAPTSNELSGDPLPYSGKKGIWGWMLFDWAAQPFHTLIITFVFAPYFASAVVTNQSAEAFLNLVGLGFMFDPTSADAGAGGQIIWGLAIGVGGVIIAFSAPIFGAIADATGPRKPWIGVFSIVGVCGCWSLWYAVPGLEDLGFIILAIIVALIGFEFSAVFNNAMMPDLVPRSELGKLSGSAWGLGYVGGLLTLVIILGFFASNPDTGKTILGVAPLFGFDTAMREGDRFAGPLSAVWFAVFLLPMFLFTPDIRKNIAVKGAVKKGMSELFATLRSLPQSKSYFNFLLSCMFYRDALNGLYTFGGIYAARVLEWSIVDIGIFGIIANITGAFGAGIGGRVDQKWGPRPVVLWMIIVLTLACLIIVSTSRTQVLFIQIVADGQSSMLPDVVFYICGAVIGAAGGALQASSRTLLVDQVPREKITEAFGLYALSGKATAFIAPFSVAWVTALSGSNRIGITPIIILFIVGIFLLIRVQGKKA